MDDEDDFSAEPTSTRQDKKKDAVEYKMLSSSQLQASMDDEIRHVASIIGSEVHYLRVHTSHFVNCSLPYLIYPSVYGMHPVRHRSRQSYCATSTGTATVSSRSSSTTLLRFSAMLANLRCHRDRHHRVSDLRSACALRLPYRQTLSAAYVATTSHRRSSASDATIRSVSPAGRRM